MFEDSKINVVISDIREQLFISSMIFKIVTLGGKPSKFESVLKPLNHLYRRQSRFTIGALGYRADSQ
jgi:hypothetical protein